MDTQLSKITRPLPLISRASRRGFERTGRTKRLQPTAFGAGMRGESCYQSFWLLEQVLPESAAAEPQAVRRVYKPLILIKE
jgi:hypothetical protein